MVSKGYECVTTICLENYLAPITIKHIFSDYDNVKRYRENLNNKIMDAYPRLVTIDDQYIIDTNRLILVEFTINTVNVY